MSERTIPAAVKTEIAKSEVRLAFAVYMDFPSGAVRLHTGLGHLFYDGEGWDGVGDGMGFSGFPETTDGQASGVSIEFSGCDLTHISQVIDDPFQGAACEIHLVVFDWEYNVIDGFPVFKGRLDSGTLNADGETGRITFAVENKLIDQVRPIVWRYSSADQATLHPGQTDLGFDFIPAIQDVHLVWG